MDRAALSLLRASFAVTFLAALLALGWALTTLVTRPPDGVEGEILYEASRLRHGLPLYVSPFAGAWEHGAPPSRYFVLYPPLASALLSLVAQTHALVVARAASLAAWGVALLAPVSLAAPGRRRAALFAALFAFGAFPLMLYAASGRPDALAVALASVALTRVLRRGAPDAASGALFALAALVKPNVVAIALGVTVLAALGPFARRRAASFVGGGLAVAALFAAAVHRASGGEALAHLLASTRQPFQPGLLLEQITARGPFFFAPMAAAAWALHWAGEDLRARIARAALTASAGWLLVTLGKTGSASNYFMEPLVAVVFAFAVAPPPSSSPPRARLAALAVLTQTLWVGVATARSVPAAVARASSQAELIAGARARCGVATTTIVLADEPGLELVLNGRAIQTPFQMAHLVRAGRYPLALWLADIDAPEVSAFLSIQPLDALAAERIEPVHAHLPPLVARRLLERFPRAIPGDGLTLYCPGGT